MVDVKYTKTAEKSWPHLVVAPGCNPTLQVIIGLQIPCMDKAGVAVDALPTISKIKILIHTFSPSKMIYN